jgi:hypothetical protein
MTVALIVFCVILVAEAFWIFRPLRGRRAEGRHHGDGLHP